MTERERALRIEACYEHHIAYGIKIQEDDARAKIFLNDLAGVPIEIFREACRWARQNHEGNFPPTAGQVIKAAVDIEWARDPTRYRNVNGGAPAHPRWWLRMRAGRPAKYAVQIAS
jgi:hypothetical protein